MFGVYRCRTIFYFLLDYNAIKTSSFCFAIYKYFINIAPQHVTKPKMHDAMQFKFIINKKIKIHILTELRIKMKREYPHKHQKRMRLALEPKY